MVRYCGHDERPEPYYGLRQIVEEHRTPGHTGHDVKYADGGRSYIPNGFVMGNNGITNNGPMFMPFEDVRGNVSNSEGMDAPNYWFNNTDCGQNF